MSKAEILAELPKLKLADRREIFDRICEIEEMEMLHGNELTAEEKELLDRELEDYRKNPHSGSPWEEVKERIRKSLKS